MTPAALIEHGRHCVSGHVLRPEGERQRIPLFVQFSDLDQEVIEPIGEQAELFHFGAGGIEEAPGRQVRIEIIANQIEGQDELPPEIRTLT